MFTSEFSNSGGTDSDNNVLLVSIVPLNDPVSRGDSQSITITVTDSASTPVANAEINGILAVFTMITALVTMQTTLAFANFVQANTSQTGN